MTDDTMTAAASVAPLNVPGAPIDLDAIEADHARWLESEGKEGKRANLRGLDLSGMDLSGRHLMEASLRGTLFKGANLSGADLRAADLAEAIMDGANLSGAHMAAAILARAQLHHVNADNADLTTADFSAAIAEGMTFKNARLNGAILRDANFYHADFTQATMRSANLRGAAFVEANLQNADLSSADCRDANFDRTVFTGAMLQATNFRNAKLGGVDLHSADFNVALDVAEEFQAQSMQTKLQAEQTRLSQWRSELDAREAALMQQKNSAEEAQREHEAQQAEIARQIGKFSLGFTVRFVLWLLLGGLLLVLTVSSMMQVQNPRMDRLGIVIGGVAIVLLLAFLSMLRSLQVARLIKAAAGSTSFPVKTTVKTLPREPVLSAEPASTPAVAKGKKTGAGFGKKK